MRKLPVYLGYTVDTWLSEFRKFDYGTMPEFISFNSKKDKKLLYMLGKELKMKLLPEDILKALPPLYSQGNVENPLVVCKFFYPDFSWTWYVIEYDGKDTFYGLVDGDEKELGYFSLSELLSTRGKLGLPIERDRYFKPCLLSTLQ